MSDDTQPKAQPLQEQSQDLDDVAPVATVASAVLGAFFDELKKTEGLTETADKLRTLVLSDGVMAEPSIRAILFRDAT